MRRAWALALAGVLLAGVTVGYAASRGVLTETRECLTTIGTLVNANPSRVNLTLQNVGTIHVGVSGQMHANATLAANGFFSLHAGSVIEFSNFQGGLSCTAAGSVNVQVIEEIQ